MPTTTATTAVQVPAFDVGALAHVPGVDVTLVPSVHGWEGRPTAWKVHRADATAAFLGYLERDGSNWRASAPEERHGFIGDHYPARTKKNSRAYALKYLVARYAGFRAHRLQVRPEGPQLRSSPA